MESFEHLRKLKDGWLEGEGIAPNNNGLDWLAEKLRINYPHNFPRIYSYPTSEGGVSLEWQINPYDIELEVNLKTHQGEYNSFNVILVKFLATSQFTKFNQKSNTRNLTTCFFYKIIY